MEIEMTALHGAFEDAALASPERPRPRRAQSWFPLRFDVAEHEAFKTLTPRKKVMLLDIFFRLSEHSWLCEKGLRKRPQFTESDGAWAARLRVSVPSFRTARRELGRNLKKPNRASLGWFDYRPGHGDRFGNLFRTQYHGAKWARVLKGERARCAAIDRSTWAVLVSALGQGRANHADLAAHLAALYLWELCGGLTRDSIFMGQDEIERLTGIKAHAFRESLAGLAESQIAGHDGRIALFGCEEGKWQRRSIVEIFCQPSISAERIDHGLLLVGKEKRKSHHCNPEHANGRMLCADSGPWNGVPRLA